MKKHTIRATISLAFSLLLIAGCKDGWQDHNELSANENSTLLERIASEPDLSKFYTLVLQAKLDSSLTSSKAYTVWAPNNAAIDALNAQSPTYLSDPAAVRTFVSFHIVPATISGSGTQPFRIKTISGLYSTVTPANFEDETIKTKGLLGSNGVLNILSTAVSVKPSVFSAAVTLAAGKQQGSAMTALDTAGTDPAGKPIIKRSARWSAIASDLSSPDSLRTYFVLADAAYNTELTRITPFYSSSKTRPDSTTNALTKLAMIENLIVKGYYSQDQLPDTLVSIGGTKMPIKKSAVVSTVRANNGIVYLMSEMPYRLKDRVREFKIEGEQSSGRTFSRTDKSGNITTRTKLDSLGVQFTDLEAYGHGTSEFYAQYKVPGVHSVTYDVYIRAVSGLTGDSQTTAFTERFGVPVTTAPATNQIVFTYAVPVKRYREMYLGRYTSAQMGTLTWRMIAAASTTNGANTLLLDYLRFVPVLP